MLTTANLAADPWTEVVPSTVRKSWHKILPIPEEQADEQPTGNADVEEEVEHLMQELGEENPEQAARDFLENDEADLGY